MLPHVTFNSTSLLLQAAVHTMRLRKTQSCCQAQVGPVNPEYSKPWIIHTHRIFSGQGFTLRDVFFRLCRDILLIMYFSLASKLLFLMVIYLTISHKNDATLRMSSKNQAAQITASYFAQHIATINSKRTYLFPCSFYHLRCFALLHVLACNSQNIMIHYI